MADRLGANQHLDIGGMLISQDGRYRLQLQNDSNLVLYYVPDGHALWASNTVGRGVTTASMQGDGNFVLYEGTRAVWASNTNQAGSFLIMQNDGNAVIYGPHGPIWSTNTDENSPHAFDSGTLTVSGSMPLSGSCHLVVFRDGTWSFSCHAHDAGFDNLHYIITAIFVPQNGKPYSFEHHGGLEGTAAGLPFGTPRRDDDFDSGTMNSPKITESVDDIRAGKLTASISANDATLDWIQDAFGKILIAAGVAAATLVVSLLGGPAKKTDHPAPGAPPQDG